ERVRRLHAAAARAPLARGARRSLRVLPLRDRTLALGVQPALGRIGWCRRVTRAPGERARVRAFGDIRNGEAAGRVGGCFGRATRAQLLRAELPAGGVDRHRLAVGLMVV